MHRTEARRLANESMEREQKRLEEQAQADLVNKIYPAIKKAAEGGRYSIDVENLATANIKALRENGYQVDLIAVNPFYGVQSPGNNIIKVDQTYRISWS